MPRNTKAGEKPAPDELWIASRYSLKGPFSGRAWENPADRPPSSNRYLELADIALGLKKPAQNKKKSKSEPYSR